MEEKKEEKKRKYPSYINEVKDIGDYVSIDVQYADGISFLEGVNGFRIPKNYLAHKLRFRFRNAAWPDESDESESINALLEELTMELFASFDEEMLHYKKLWNKHFLYEEDDDPLDVMFRTYVAYVLKSELYQEYLRIQEVIDRFSLDRDTDSYYAKIRHAVEYPGESEEDRLKREEETKRIAQKWERFMNDSD